MITTAHSIELNGKRVGSLLQRGDVARFMFDSDYWNDPQRNILGLWFEDNPRQSPQAALRLPPWFSNLLPEGPLRSWIAQDRGVSVDRELQLLLQIGHDLPGAVVVSTAEGEPDVGDIGVPVALRDPISDRESPWKFSLAGVGLKFSMLRTGDRLSVPAANQLGDWIVKFPDAVYPDVPANEFATMNLAKSVGIDCPDIELLHRDELPPLPDVMWPGREALAYAIARFDRTATGGRVHIEDLAQVRGFYPQQKYSGSFETVGALLYRGQDHSSLREFVRRLVFNLLIGNGDAHLKNWSLIYRDAGRPEISPAYDIVSTACYYEESAPDDLGLKLGGSKLPRRVSRSDFTRLQSLLGVQNEDVLDVLDETLEAFATAWGGPDRDRFPESARLWIDSSAPEMTRRLRARET